MEGHVDNLSAVLTEEPPPRKPIPLSRPGVRLAKLIRTHAEAKVAYFVAAQDVEIAQGKYGVAKEALDQADQEVMDFVKALSDHSYEGLLEELHGAEQTAEPAADTNPPSAEPQQPEQVSPV